MTKKHLFSASFFLLLLLLTTVNCQAQNSKKYPDFLGKEQVPDFEYYLPAPPLSGNAAFVADSFAYEEGKKLRNTARGEQAISHADISVEHIISIFSKSMDIDLPKKEFPFLYFVIERTMNDAYHSINAAKHHYKRIRPYVYFNEPSGIYEDEESHRTTYSYPSAHSAMAWAATLVLTELFPNYQNAILHTGYEIGDSRVIVGYHYQSDVSAARIAASATVSHLHAYKPFVKAMRKARKEVARYFRNHRQPVKKN